MQKRAFSLAEVILVMMLLSGMLVFSLTRFGSEKRRASSDALVQVVAAELVAARALAVRTHSPVAVCFPSQGGSLPHSQSLYVMEGPARARMTRVVNYAREYQDAVIAVSCWGNPTLDRPRSGENTSPLSVERWLGSGFQDYALVFAPDGSVTSNDLPLLNGSYHLLVASQFAYVSGSTPPGVPTVTTPPGYFTLTRAHAPHTIAVSVSGSVAVESGVLHQGAVEVTPQSLAMPAPAAAPSLPAQASVAPVIQNIDVKPLAGLTPKASVQQGRSLTLKVQASDPDGDPLLSSWTSVNLGAGTESGDFSLPPQAPMEWDPQAQLWTSTVTWTPPTTASSGNSFRLECKVVDPKGLSDTKVHAALDPVTVTPPGRFVYSWHANPLRYEISIIDGDGSNEKRLTVDTTDDDSPCLSPDGKKIVFVSKRHGQTELFVMNSDGSDQRRLTNNTVEDWSPHWSVDGSQIFFGRNWPDRVWVMNADGTGAVSLSTGGYASEYGITPSPDGRYVMYVGNKNAPGVPQVSGELVVGEYINDRVNPPRVADATNLTNNSEFRIGDSFHCWFPDATGRFLYTSTDPQGQQYYTNALRTLRVARLVDNGAGSVPPRFQMTDVHDLHSTTNYYTDYSSVRIAPNLRSLIYHQNSFLYVADFDSVSVPPAFSNPKKLTTTSPFQSAGNWSRF